MDACLHMKASIIIVQLYDIVYIILKQIILCNKYLYFWYFDCLNCCCHLQVLLHLLSSLSIFQVTVLNQLYLTVCFKFIFSGPALFKST